MTTGIGTRIKGFIRAALLCTGLMLAACSSAPVIPAPAEVPLANDTLTLLGKKGMQAGAPVFVRIFKEESELEIWKQRDDGRFYHFKTYPICNWSGELGPKLAFGDKQAPEGFYSINPVLMNPNSKFYLSFNVGYPNSYDKAQGRTGDGVMVHGKCRSAGCYAMTDALMEEIYGLTRESLKAGQPTFQLHAFPFRMTDARMAEMKKHKWYSFWKTLKEGYDYFETYHLPPQVAVCERRYVVNAVTDQSRIDPDGPCPKFQRPVVTAFTPTPVDQTLANPILVADGNKLKGIASADAEPTAADITKAHETAAQAKHPVTPGTSAAAPLGTAQ